MIYIQTDISIESIKVGGTTAKGTARKLILTNNSLHTASTAYVRDVNSDPYLYELMPIDGLGFDFSSYLPGEYTLAVIGDEDEVLVENILVLRTVDNLEIFYDEEYPSEIIDQIPVISLEILDAINGEIIGVSYDDKTKAILESVLAIKAAIEEKGEEVDGDPLRTYADHIRNIETSSPATITIKQGDNEQSFQLNQKNDQTIEIVEGQPHWFGTRAEYDAIEEKDPDTIYHVKEPIPYDDISGKPVIGDGKITIKQGDSEQTFTLNQEGDQTIEIVDGQPHWFGTRAEYDAIEEKDPNTIYHVKEPISYEDLSDKPNIGNGKITIKQGDNEQTFTLNQEGDQTIEITGGTSDDKHWFGTQAEYDAIEVKDPDMIYCIEGDTVNNPTITIRQGGIEKGTFTLNQPNDVVIDLDEGGATDWDDIENKPDFKPVATSGSYQDLDDKPIIEPVYDSIITIIQGGVEKGRFSLNQSNSQTIEIDAGGASDDKHWFGTQAEYDAIEEKDPDVIYCIEGGGSINWDDIQNKPEFKQVATSGDYNDLNNKPEIPSVEGLASEQWVEEQGYLTEHQDISGKVDRTELAPVATSGDYNDLNNKPEIPSKTSDLTNDSGFITGWTQADWNTDNPTYRSYIKNKPEIPSRSENWTFELEDGSTVTKKIWLD